MRNRCILRTAALLSLGAFGVHQGRYLLGYGRHAEVALASQGHRYLSTVVVPLLIGLLTLALAGVLLRTLGPGGDRRRASIPHTWLLCTAALIAMYVVQELAEGALAAGHPGGLAGVVGHGGWIAAPLAVAVGGLVALALTAAGAAEASGAGAGVSIELRFAWPAAWRPAAAPDPARPAPVLARHLAGRGPPLLCR
jgi:hypothetical protein